MSKVKVLIAIDDPDHAKTLVHSTYNIVDVKNSEITLLNVIETTVAEENFFYSEPENFIEHESDKSDFAYLENFLESSETDYKGFIYKEGDAAHVINKTISEGGYDLVVLGLHNKTPLERLLPGSTAYKVTGSAKCSVLVINNSYKIKTHKSKPFSVSACVDMTETAYDLAENAGNFLDKSRAEVSLLHATIPPTLLVPPDAYIYIDLNKIICATEKAALDFLDKVGEVFIKHNVNVTKKYIKEGDTVEIILGEAENNDTDVIIVNSKNKGALSKIFLGSVSRKVYEHAKVPVLIIREAKG